MRVARRVRGRPRSPRCATRGSSRRRGERHRPPRHRARHCEVRMDIEFLDRRGGSGLRVQPPERARAIRFVASTDSIAGPDRTFRGRARRLRCASGSTTAWALAATACSPPSPGPGTGADCSTPTSRAHHRASPATRRRHGRPAPRVRDRAAVAPDRDEYIGIETLRALGARRRGAPVRRADPDHGPDRVQAALLRLGPRLRLVARCGRSCSSASCTCSSSRSSTSRKGPVLRRLSADRDRALELTSRRRRGTRVTCLVAREGMLRKIRFPRMVVPLSVSLTATFNLGDELHRGVDLRARHGVTPTILWLEMIPIVLRLHRPRHRHRDAPVGAVRPLP